MSFPSLAITASVLVMLTICVQSAGMAVLIHWGRFRFAHGMHKLRPLHSTALMIRFTSLMIGLHLAQIGLWAGVYRWRCFQSWESAWYFSMTSYSTVGYGDLVPPQSWRMLGPLESVSGVLMCGLSVGLLFAIVTRLVGQQETQPSSESEMPPVSQ
jgi:voltage-gated potassium channel